MTSYTCCSWASCSAVVMIFFILTAYPILLLSPGCA
jgi:hypothetical protein